MNNIIGQRCRTDNCISGRDSLVYSKGRNPKIDFVLILVFFLYRLSSLNASCFKEDGRGGLGPQSLHAGYVFSIANNK